MTTSNPIRLRNFDSGLARAACAALAAVVLASSGLADAPPDINLQGRLFDNGGDPLPGPVNLTVRIYGQLSGGSVLFQEDHGGVALEDGVFNLVIGSGSVVVGQLDASLFEGVNRYLELVVNGAAMEPRQPFNSVAYSLQSQWAANAESAEDAQTLGGLSASDFASSAHHHDGVYAAISHGHSAYALFSHDHDSRYAPSSHTHSGFAAIAHTHDADDLTTGLLSTSRFDAYSDLSVSARLDNSDASDLLTRSQADSRYVNTGETQATVVTSGDYSYSSTRFVTKMISAFDFQESNQTGAIIARQFSSGLAYIYSGSTPYRAELLGRIEVPVQARVTDVTCYYYDNDASFDISDFNFRLYKQTPGFLPELAYSSSSASSSGASNRSSSLSLSTSATIGLAEDWYLAIFFDVTDLPSPRSSLAFSGCKLLYQTTQLHP